MAVLPNGLTAASEPVGTLYSELVDVLARVKSEQKLAYLTHIRRCLNSLRSGQRLKTTDRRPSPKEMEAAMGEHDWVKLSGTIHEFMRTWFESKVVLDFAHVTACIKALAQGNWLEVDQTPKFRTVKEQLATYLEYDRSLREILSFNPAYSGVDAAHFETAKRALDAGVFVQGDLLFYSHGDAILTAKITREYINRYVGGIYASNEPYLEHDAESELSFGPPRVRESAQSKGFPRPRGFYVKLLPMFADNGRFASHKDYSTADAVRQASLTRWPMASEAFQLFGVTHKTWSDLYRPVRFVIPGLYVKQFDSCHFGGPGWEQGKYGIGHYKEQNTDMLTIDNRIYLGLGTLCQRTNPIKPDTVCGFLDAWKPAGDVAQASACPTCQRPVYQFTGFSICSFCGSIAD